MGIEPVINGGLSFAAVLVLMALNIPIGIAIERVLKMGPKSGSK